MTDFHSVDYVLGKKVTKYKSRYDSSLLARQERKINREKYNINNDDLPFMGYDIWHSYEGTFILENGQPLSFIVKLKIPVTSKYIVESKSLKLYLFSYAMQVISGNEVEALDTFKSMVKHDLSELLEYDIKINVFQEKDYHPVIDNVLSSAVDLSTIVDYSKIKFDTLGENPDILEIENNTGYFVKTDMLRSKCPITGQPDYGTIFIKIKSDKVPTLNSLAKYIYSLREEPHFHEEIIECIYKRLYDLCQPEDLLVTAIYTRRGGIDICPIRTNKKELMPPVLSDINKLKIKEYRQ